MDPPEFSAGKSPRKELQLQGPRPTPLKVREDSHKIKKPHHHRPPVIIYTVSPKVIHTQPSEFMTLVQRLTGRSSFHNTGAISPAARFASIEKTKSSPEKKKAQSSSSSDHPWGVVHEGTIDTCTELERTSLFPGILSPSPAVLPAVPPNFFSPPSDQNPMSFFHDFSPVLQDNRNYLETSFMPSPNFFSPHIITSPPQPHVDLFNNFFDL